MYVAIALDSGSSERAIELADLLIQYGFKMVQKGLWECTTISSDTLNRVKRDLDKATDADDRLKLFQFPMEGTLVISTLKDKKWRRTVAKDVEVIKVRTVSRLPHAKQEAGAASPAASSRPAGVSHPAASSRPAHKPAKTK